MSDTDKKKEEWMNSKWRPMMGWTYMATCITDFILFPILWSILQASLGQSVTAWKPLTLEGAGLFHVAMGAVLGLTAWGRTQEKLQGANNGGLPSQSNTNFDNPYSGTYGNSTQSNVTTGFGGKAAPPPAAQPLL